MISRGSLHIPTHMIHAHMNAPFLPLEERIPQLCHKVVESKEHYVFHHSVVYEIGERYHYLFRKSFGPLCKVMEY